MKNFFLTILLVLITIFGLSAQTPLNLNGFTHTVTPGQCRADAKIKVTLPPTIGASGTKLQVKLDKPNGTSVTEPLEIAVSGKDSHEFTLLTAGVHTITLIEVATAKSSVPRAVTVASTYIAPTFTVNTQGPNCAGTGNDGKITFAVAAGVRGPLAVKITGPDGEVYSQTHNAPAAPAKFTLTVQGTDAKPLKAGQTYQLSVQDLAGGTPDCGDTSRSTFTIPASQLSLSCLNVRINYQNSGVRMNANCKFSFSFQIERTDGGSLLQYDNTIKTTPNIATVRRYNSAGVLQASYNVSSSYTDQWLGSNVSYPRSFVSPYVFEEGDIAEMEINIGATPIKHKFKLDKNVLDLMLNSTNPSQADGSFLFRGRDGGRMLEVLNRSDLNPNPTDPCPTPNTKKYLYLENYFRSIYLPDADDPTKKVLFGTYYWFNDFYKTANFTKTPSSATGPAYYYEIYQYLGTGYPGWDAGYTTNNMNENDTTKWKHLRSTDDGGSDYTWINANYADLTGLPDGYYMVKYVAKKADGTLSCYQPKRITEMKTLPNQIADRFNGLEINKGAFKGTVSIRKWLSGAHFNYPIKVKIDYLDDGAMGTTRTYDFVTSLPFESLRTVTYTFPIEKEVLNPETSNEMGLFQFGDIPAGNYRLTLTDNCNNTTYKDFNFDTPMQYDKDEVKVVRGCANTSKISYELAAPERGSIMGVEYRLLKKNNSGNYVVIKSSNKASDTFNDLQTGDYLFETRGYYYARIKTGTWKGQEKAPNGDMKWTNVNDPTSTVNGYSMIDSPDLRDLAYPHRDGIVSKHTSRTYLTISPTGELDLEVLGSSCGATPNSGFVGINIKNPEYIVYPLQFTLKTTGGAVAKTSPVFQEGSNVSSYVFKNVANGNYVVEISHACRVYNEAARVDTGNYTAPPITYTINSTSPCNGDEVKLTFGGSIQLFDIEWFRIEKDNSRTSLGISQTVTDTVKRNTTYIVEYKLIDSSLCVTNNSGVSSVTVNFAADNVPPVITGCPTGTITVNTQVGKCYGVATWGTVTATDDCRIDTWSQTHQSGDHFDVGLHTVTYVFVDTAGNAATCTFNVEVKSKAINMEMSDDFVDGTNGVINRQLANSESFNYRITYQNKGQENVTSATMQITLPSHPALTVGTPDFSGAAWNLSTKPTVLGQTSTTLTLSIPIQTLNAGGQKNTILIPMTLNGDCNEIGKPCMNLLHASYSFTYEGGRAGCIIPAQTSTGSKTIEISTQGCSRTELHCAGATTSITAVAGFDEYIWYQGTTRLANPLNHNYIEATATGTYRVEKIQQCNGTTYTTTEIIQLVGIGEIADPIRAKFSTGDVCASDQSIWMNHIILCNEPSRTISLNYRNTKMEWQQLKAGNTHITLNCPDKDDSKWETVSTNSSFTVSTTASYRLRISNANNDCYKDFYFDVFNNALSGEIDYYRNISSYETGQIRVKMATSGIAYKYVLKDSNGNIVPQNGQQFITSNSPVRTFTINDPDIYTIEVTSPALPSSCKFTISQKITKEVTLKPRATAKAWKGCNLRVINFQAEGGQGPYSFAIWSIDGVVQNNYQNYSDIQPSHYITTSVPSGNIGLDVNTAITQPGRYIFVAKDAQDAYALTPEIDIYPESFLGYSIKTRNVVCGSAENSGQISITYNTQQNVRSKLYKYDDLGNEVYVDENTTGYFYNLTAGRYNLKIEIQLSSSVTCQYNNPNIEIKNEITTLRAYAGVAEDISCDTNSPTKQYKVIVNNVSGGTGTGYEYSVNNVNYSTNNVLMVGSTASVVYVRDSNKCTLEIPIKITPIVPATVTSTAVTYDCEGKGTFTITTNPTGGVYQYQLTKSDGTISETRTSNVFTLSPGVYSVYAIYTPANMTGTTPNILFKEDFGIGLDTCNTDNIFIVCNSNGTSLESNQYMITRQVPGKPNWVSPTPTDASAVTDGRYLAINGGSTNRTSDEGVVYRRVIKDVVVGQELNVTMNLFNLLPSNYIGENNPNLVVRLYNPGNRTIYEEKALGELQRTGAWVNKKITFAASQINYNSVEFELRNIANANYLAVDDIILSQPTKLCSIRTEGVSVNVESNRQFSVRGTASDEKCGTGDGSMYLVVNNAGGSTIEYQLQGTTTWTSVTLSATTATQGVATITNLSAVNNGAMYLRKTNDPDCQTDITYTIKKPIPLTVTATIEAPVTCLNTFASVHLTGDGGAKPYRTFRAIPLLGGTTATQPAVNNEADFNLSVGNYRIEVEDANGCVGSATLEIANAKPLKIEVIDLAPCFSGGSNGSIQVNVLSGNGEYQFSKDGGANYESSSTASGTTMIYNNLTAGTYNIWVRDGGSCVTNTTYTIDNPLRIQTIRTVALGCVANSEAVFSVTHTGGKTGTREFLWSNSPTTNFSVAIPTGMSLATSGNEYVFKTQIEGDYYFKVRYQMDNGDYCEVVSSKQEVKREIPRFVVTPTAEPVNCAGVNSGKIRINSSDIAGGTPPYTLLFDNGLTTVQHSVISDIVGLAPGTYTLTIKDSASCQSVPVGLTITQVPPMVATVTHTSLKCTGSNTIQKSKITALVSSGGTAPFTVTVFKNGVRVDVRTGVLIDTNVEFDNMDIGRYRVVIEDSKSCKYTQEFDVNSEANGLDVRATNVTGCAGNSGEVAVSVYDKLGSGIGAVHYIAVYQDGMSMPTNPYLPSHTYTNATITTTWYRMSDVTTTTLSDNSIVQAATYTFTAGTNGMVPGVKYTFVVYDKSTGCSFTKEANIPVPTRSPLKTSVNGTKPTTCYDANDGKVFINLKDWPGTSVRYDVYKYPPTHPLLTEPTDVTGSNHPVWGLKTLTGTASIGEDITIEGIPPGRYFVLFTDAGLGCTQGTEEFTIGRSTSQLTASVTVAKKATCQQPQDIGKGKIVVDAQGGQAPYEYYYEPITTPLAAVLTSTTLDNAFIINQQGASLDVVSGYYRVYIRDNSGCLVHTVVTVDIEPSPSIASVDVQDACSENVDYPINIVFATKGVGQHQYKIDGITSWQNLTMPTAAADMQVNLPIRLAPNVASYTLSIRDANGCETSTTFKVNEMMKFEAEHTSLVPCGAGVATITVKNITGGSGKYRVSLYRITSSDRAVPLITADNIGSATTYVIDGATYNLTAGSYRINVYDDALFGTAAECAKILPFTIVKPETPKIEVIAISTPACYGDEATIRVKVTPAAEGPYVFSFTDTNGLPVATASITANHNYATISGVPSGPITLGGKGYIIYAESVRSCTVSTVATATSPDVVSVTAGALTKKDYGCERDEYGYLTGESAYPKLTFNLGAVTGGTTPYTRVEFREVATNRLVNQQTVEDNVTDYTYTLPNYLTADTDYYVQVYDSNGCSATSTRATISSTLIMSALTVSQTQVLTCANGTELIDITLSTTTAYNNELITYTITKIGEPAAFFTRTATALTLSGVASITEAGYYVVTAKNESTGCEISTNYTVLDPRTLLLEAKDIERVQCKGGNGKVTFELTDNRLSDGDQVANGFSYVIYDMTTNSAVSTGTTNGTLTPGKVANISLPAGKYRVEATSLITGCSANTTFELIEAENPITVFSQETASVTCSNDRAEIMVTVSGGWAPYTVNISGGSITGQDTINLEGDSVLFKNLASTGTPGGVVTYTITITDAWGCSTASGTTEVAVLFPDLITGTITVTQHATCFGSSDGIIEAITSTIQGGSGSYYYSLIDTNYNTRGPQRNNAKFSNLSPGIYTFEIMDTWGCVLREEQIEVIEPKPITVSVTSADLQVCYGESTGGIHFYVEGGRPPYEVKIIDKFTNIIYHNESGVYTTTEVIAPNLSPLGGSGLPAGDYRIEITDAGQGAGVGCTMSPTYDFKVVSAPDMEAEVKQGYNCDNNEFTTWIEVRFKDEVNFNDMTYLIYNGVTTPTVPQTFSRNNGYNIGYIDQTRFDRSIATQTIQFFYTSVHSLTGQVKSCSHTLSKPISIEEIYQISNIVKTPTTVVNTLQVEAVGGKKPYKYEFNGEFYDENNLYELKRTDPDYTDPVSGKVYKIVNVVAYDSAGLNGCTVSKTFYEEYFDVFIPNYFTPNGDGTYDTWSPRNIEKYPFIKTSIYDRYGRRLKVLRYGEEWDGKYESRDMPVGDYWYIVELSDEDDNRTFKGNFTLYR
ncbi:T9SS type B sorting domain-containing protein [Capnocytophaga leadbetteri]